MIRPPFGVRLLLGVAATVLEETRKLPQAVLTYPMTAASQTVQNFMRFQQTVTELAIKGDETWENIFPPTEEQQQTEAAQNQPGMRFEIDSASLTCTPPFLPVVCRVSCVVCRCVSCVGACRVSCCVLLR